MDNRLKKLLDKASVQTKRSGVAKSVKFDVDTIQNERENRNKEVPKTPVVFAKLPEPRAIETADDDDEIKAYLNQLSRKTKIETNENVENKNSESDISPPSSLDSFIQEFKGKNEKLPPKNNHDDSELKTTFGDNAKIERPQPVNSSKTNKTLEKVTHYENKYLKSTPRRSYLLDSESDISDLSLDKSEIPSLHVMPIEEIQKTEIEKNLSKNDLSSDEEESINSQSPIPVLLEDLHLVDELIEVISNDENAGISVESESKNIKTESNVSEEKLTSYEEDFDSSSDKIATVISSNNSPTVLSDDEIVSEEKSDFHLLKNVHFDTISEVEIDSVTKEDDIASSRIISSESLSDSSTSITKSSSPLPEEILPVKDLSRPKKSDIPPRHQRSFGVQVKLATPSTHGLFLHPQRMFDVEIEPRNYTSTLTQLVLKQTTLETLAAVNPSVLALNEMIRDQINFTKAFQASHERLYASQLANLQPDYRYTTWKDTLKDVRRYRKKQLKKSKSVH